MLASRWAKMAALYFMIGSTFGMFMGITKKFEFATAHAHINLLGWASMGVIAFLHKGFPALEEGTLAKVNFWLYQCSFPLFALALILTIAGNPIGEKLTVPGASLTLISVLMTGIRVWTSVKAPVAEQRQTKAS